MEKEMTKEEAIKKIKEVMYQFQASLDEVDVDEACAEAEENNRQVVEALNMAIKALEQQPCEDAISSEPRKIDEWDIKGKTAELWIVNGKLQIRYQGTIHNTDLPFVTPIRPKGKWIYKGRPNGMSAVGTNVYQCSVCGREIGTKHGWKTVGNEFPFCHCGADMRGKNNEND